MFQHFLAFFSHRQVTEAFFHELRKKLRFMNAFKNLLDPGKRKKSGKELNHAKLAWHSSWVRATHLYWNQHLRHLHFPVCLMRMRCHPESAWTDCCWWAIHCGPEHARIQIEVLGHSLVCSLAPLTRLLAPHFSLRSRTPLRSLVCLLAHSITRRTVIDW